MELPMNAAPTLWILQLFIWLVAVGTAHAQDEPKRFTIWDIHIGDVASDVPNEFAAYACGTNGGPPSIPLANFTEFKRCKPEASGLREVYFEYDDELEYRARALNITSEIRRYAGTTVFEFPIVASLLFDQAGRAMGERLVTDPRQHSSRRRIEFWTLANFLRQRYGQDGWSCKDLPPADGEGPAGTTFIKNHCEKRAHGLHFILEQRYLQKKGQRFLDPHTGKPESEAYESETRFELYDAAAPGATNDAN
jgi:hypothetical protein